MKKKTSEIWGFFRAVDDTYALCNICKAKLSYKTTTTNLSKHMHRMHPTSNAMSTSMRDRKYKIMPHSSDRYKNKPRNPEQEIILLNFIKKHPVLMQNPSWETRNSYDALWDQLSSELNGNGPPQKDVGTWKKALKDWKRFIMKKVEKNEMHNIPLASGLSSAEETIASLCRLNDDVTQIANQSDDDLHDNSNATFDMEDVEDVVPKEEDHSVLQDASGYVYEPDDFKADIEIDPLILQGGKRSSYGGKVIQKEFETLSKNLSSVQDTTSSMQQALNEFCTLYKQKLIEDKRHHAAMEQLMTEKIELKKKLLELEQKKLSFK